MTLEKLLNPEKVAVVGASRHAGKTGHEVFDNLLHDFSGRVYPVNPNAEKIEGINARDNVEENTDLAVIAVPAKLVPEILDQCGDVGVEAAVIISAGFSEAGNDSLESEVSYMADKHGITILGPNVLGLINTENSMNASFASKTPEPGKISFMSQSGAFCTAILDYSEPEHIGFHHFVSLGNKMQLNEVDFLEKWRKDDETETILAYTEGIENGRGFLEEARETAEEKPIVMVKSGRTEEGGNAASSHTGSLAGSIDAYRAAFRQSGVIEAESSRELLNLGKAFQFQPLPEGKKVAVITNAGGPGVITTDEINERGLEVAEFFSRTKDLLEKSLPDEATPENPVDVIGDAGHRRYKEALTIAIEDPNVDAAVVILTPQANTEIEKTAKSIADIASKTDKPVMASFMGEKDVEKGGEILEERRVPNFEDPKDAVKALKVMKDYRNFLERNESFLHVEKDSEKAEAALKNFTGFEDARDLIEAYGFRTPLTEVAETSQEAVENAARIGYPVVLKANSSDITHKTDIGGVETGLGSREGVEDAFGSIIEDIHEEKPGAKIEGVQVQEQLEGLEIALGVKQDPQFGPVVMVGLGGIYIEALKDVSYGIPPISEETAEDMIQELRSHELFEGVRGENHSTEPVKNAIIRLGELALDFEEKIQSIDINPLILEGEDVYAADIQVELNDS
jgi:acetyl coenzyme A synthetase (ADP forming)-like protein